MRGPLVACCLAAGCASANVGITGDDDVAVDAPRGIDAPEVIDGPPIDSPPTVTQTLSETTNNQNTASNSVTCTAAPGVNHWYRVFRPSAFGIQGTFSITQVTFGAQEATGSPQVTVNVGTYTGTLGAPTLDTTKMAQLATTAVTIPNLTDPGNNQVANVAATIPAGADLYVELFVPTQDAAKFFFIGASNAGETQPGYLLAPTCVDGGGAAINVPKSTASIGAPTANLNITVTGTHN